MRRYTISSDCGPIHGKYCSCRREPPMSLFSLAGRRALVTGAARGIGFAIAESLSTAGASVILNGRTPAALEAAAVQLRSRGADAGVSCFDVTDAAAVAAAVTAIEEQVGPIDILVNNAGIQRRASLEKFADA